MRWTNPTRRRVWRITLAGLVAAILAVAPTAWLRLASAGHVHDGPGGTGSGGGGNGRATRAPVAIVFGSEVTRGSTAPKTFLRGRLDTAVELVRAERVKAVLVSGDAHGGSGNEVAVMSRYLTDHGVPPRLIVVDGYGLDTYDTCRRAHDVYGVSRALLVSQAFHLPRAVTLCRGLGIDADGVAARCDDCRPLTLARNTAREVAAAWKALYDRVSDRPPAVSSPRSDEVRSLLVN